MADVGSTTEDPCGPSPTDKLGLRVAAIFVILFSSLVCTLFPIVAKRVPFLRRNVPGVVFEFAKYFGSGVILATGFIHLLEPATDEIGEGNTIENGGCIPNGWAEYPYAFAIALSSLFFTFVIQLIAYRVGTERLEKMGLMHDQRHPHVTGHPHVSKPGQESSVSPSNESVSMERAMEKGDLSDVDSQTGIFSDASERSPLIAQMIGVATLEFGVIFHSLIIGLTLAVTGPDEFTVLFIVIVFHQAFEGLGLGTRLAFLRLPSGLGWLPYLGAGSYAVVTPIGMAIGLGVRESLSMSSGSASIAAGVLDAISAGVLIYTATVELMAHEFVFNKHFQQCSWPRLVFALVSFMCGTGIMALLGKWA